MIYILLSLVFVALLILVFVPEQKAAVEVEEVQQPQVVEVKALQAEQAKQVIQTLAKTSVVGSIIPQPLSSIFKDEEEVDFDWPNTFVAPSESDKKMYAYFERLEKTSRYGGVKIKWSTIYGREFGRKRKLKIKRSKAKEAKRVEKQLWSSFNEYYEDELPYEIERVVLTNKRDAFLAIK